MSPPKIENGLLQALTRRDLALLTPGFERVALELEQPIELPNQPIKHVYFPESGVISVVGKTRDQNIEAGLIGKEGMSGLAIVLGDDRSPHHSFVQMAGSAQRLSASRLRSALDESDTLRRVMQRFALVFLTQIAQTAVANGKAKVEERLARWLLMAQDRQGANELRLTHEFIAIMLGVRRAGVTDALHQLESKRLIRAERGVIFILSRKGLISAAGDIYGVPEAEYERLIR